MKETRLEGDLHTLYTVSYCLTDSVVKFKQMVTAPNVNITCSESGSCWRADAGHVLTWGAKTQAPSACGQYDFLQYYADIMQGRVNITIINHDMHITVTVTG